MLSTFPFRPSGTGSAGAALPAPRRISRALVVFTMLAQAATVTHAQSNFEEDFDDYEKPWQEVAVQLPPVPQAENLLPFYVSPTATQSFAIDAKSITVGADNVVRYTLVATSPSGVKNISYEGIRCQLLQKKLYAFGHADGSWSRSRRDQWEPISGNAANRQHAALAGDYLCEGRTVAGNPAQMVNRIRKSGALIER